MTDSTPYGITAGKDDLTWETAPAGVTLWAVYGPDSFPTVFACKLNDHPAVGRVLWGFSIYKRKPGFRTLGVGEAWAKDHDLRLFSTPAEAFAHVASLFARAHP